MAIEGEVSVSVKFSNKVFIRNFTPWLWCPKFGKKNFILMSVGKNLKRHMFQHLSFANLLVDLQQ
jgi:hypothetical protein